MNFSDKKFRIFAVVFPIAIIAMWISSYGFLRQTAREFTFSIVGFDPRDLLSGHYLQYRIDYKMTVQCQRDAREWCLCIEDSEPFSFASQEGRCDELSCSASLKGYCEGLRFVAGIERYYFPEKYKSKLVLVPPESTVTVSLSNSGQAVVKSMQVENIPLLQWLEQQGD